MVHVQERNHAVRPHPVLVREVQDDVEQGYAERAFSDAVRPVDDRVLHQSLRFDLRVEVVSAGDEGKRERFFESAEIFDFELFEHGCVSVVCVVGWNGAHSSKARFPFQVKS